ncbi:hypothetical protein LCGC14_2029070 [marine sediment metagenome]|uniref:Uncharacterized protein n=1 Tax=marine sediment metagenome TaxID=412755 RepID=A0A0F9H8M8_9ZZZZ
MVLVIILFIVFGQILYLERKIQKIRHLLDMELEESYFVKPGKIQLILLNGL